MSHISKAIERRIAEEQRIVKFLDELERDYPWAFAKAVKRKGKPRGRRLSARDTGTPPKPRKPRSDKGRPRSSSEGPATRAAREQTERVKRADAAVEA